jgi:hypothetical protein
MPPPLWDKETAALFQLVLVHIARWIESVYQSAYLVVTIGGVVWRGIECSEWTKVFGLLWRDECHRLAAFQYL